MDKEEKNISTPPMRTELEEGFMISQEEGGIIVLKINSFWIVRNTELLKKGEINEEELMDIFRNVLEKIPHKSKIFANIGEILTSNVLSNANVFYRKNIANFLKRVIKIIEFKKIALCGGGTAQRVGISFILRASGLDNIRIFKAEEEALKWLKEG